MKAAILLALISAQTLGKSPAGALPPVLAAPPDVVLEAHLAAPEPITFE